MLRLIAILSFAFLWSTVNGVARCPFPGRTNGASFTDNSINWQNLPSFGEGETVQYECNGDWRTLEGVDYSLTCQRNGLWNGPLPVCGYHATLDHTSSCSSGIEFDNIPFIYEENTKELYEVGMEFCSSQDFNSFLSSTLDEVNQCSRRKVDPKVIYECKQFDPRDINYKIKIKMMKNVLLPKIYSFLYPGVQCGLPPVPVDADFVGKLVPGSTTEVAYKCKNDLVLDGPQTSTCDQLTGQWTEPPRCIRPVLSPTNRSTIPKIRTDEAIHLHNKTPRPRFPDRLPRPWTRSPERIPDPNILDKGIPGDQETGQWTELPKFLDPNWMSAGVVNRSSFSLIAIIAIQLCAFSYLS